MILLSERFRHDERGMAAVFVAISLVTLVTATTLAIDVGMLMTARTQAQNAADAGALAGAVALTLDDFNDRTMNGPVVQSAVSAATAAGNNVMGQAVAVAPADVTFPVSATGAANRVSIRVSRSASRGNPLSTLMAGIFGSDTADVSATATAEATPANSAICVAPFAIPDRWTERQSGPWDPSDTFYPLGASSAKDSYVSSENAGYTGYSAQRDRGLRLTLRLNTSTGTPAHISANQYYRVDLPNSTGAEDFKENITDCNSASLRFGQALAHEPGDMSTPTREAIQELIDQDPAAHWDTANNRVVSSQNPSPRVKVVPVFDPAHWHNGKMSGRYYDMKVTNFIGVFIESISGTGEINARITPVTGSFDPAAGASPQGSFARVIRLVQ